MSDYYYWTNHGEDILPIPPVVVNHSYYGSSGQRKMFDNYEKLVMDAAGPDIGNYLEQEDQDEGDTMEEEPNEEVQRFFEMLKAAQSPLWDGCDSYSLLPASLTALSLKAYYGLSEGCFNGWMQFMGNALPNNNSYEARVGGPVQYRWMYLFERKNPQIQVQLAGSYFKRHTNIKVIQTSGFPQNQRQLLMSMKKGLLRGTHRSH
ncbi:hypothetical protein P8452_47949 [Trifolium repens]|nr:hypothetical protein P8452_47949 [Trifolium repens]